ncbi:hypothetical protein AKO1_001162 [Acrasis kona]|uniref:Uncharacterized protein n=1 Tax=Acrasis kona TaxID=1008807 RepID=A0AAW2Z3J8_9EUKA
MQQQKKEEESNDESEGSSRTNPNFAIFECLLLRYCNISNGFAQQPFLPELIEHARRISPQVTVKQLGVYFSSILRKVSSTDNVDQDSINKLTQDGQRFHKSFFDEQYGFHLVYVDCKIRELFELIPPCEDYKKQCDSFTNREKKRGRPSTSEDENATQPKKKKTAKSTPKKAKKNVFATKSSEDEDEEEDEEIEDSQETENTPKKTSKKRVRGKMNKKRAKPQVRAKQRVLRKSGRNRVVERNILE